MENCIKDAINSKIPLINEEFVSEVVSKITKIPLGRIDAAERIKLLSLDALLEKRVIGQKEATDAIAESIKRSRSGITNPKRPRRSDNSHIKRSSPQPRWNCSSRSANWVFYLYGADGRWKN